MSYNIVMDSCGEVPEFLENVISVPLTLELNDKSICDNGSCSQTELLNLMKESQTAAKSACPSPMSFLDKLGDATRTYIITLSSRLSGSFNSASVAAQMNEDDTKEICVVDSKSASVGETLVAMKIHELESKHKSFDIVVSEIKKYVENMHTYFVLESLENLQKAGRLSNVKAMAANVLNIKPVMSATSEGEIQQIGAQRGMKKALISMVDKMLADVKDSENKILAIAHCNCEERANWVKSLIEAKTKFKDIIIVSTSGVSTLYANDGGIIVAV